MSNCICITGMHRSGTSLMASWLEKCGLVISGGNLIGASTGNTKGHFEDRDFVQLHSKQLLLKFPSSKGWICNPSVFQEFSQTAKNDALKIVMGRNAKYPTWGWKDPRTTLFLRAWKELLPDMVAFLVWRPCRDVVRSLLKRSKSSGRRNKIYKVDVLNSVRIWIAYNNLICVYKNENPSKTILISLQHAIENDRDLFYLINSKLGGMLTYVPLSSVLEKPLLTKTGIPWSNWLCKLYNSKFIEVRLTSISDVFGN